MKKVRKEIPSSVVVTKNITTTSTIEKKIVYQIPELMSETDKNVFQSLHFEAMEGKLLFEKSPSTRGKGGPKMRRKAEPGNDYFVVF